MRDGFLDHINVTILLVLFDIVLKDDVIILLCHTVVIHDGVLVVEEVVLVASLTAAEDLSEDVHKLVGA